MLVRDRIIDEVNELPENELLKLQDYINFLKFQERFGVATGNAEDNTPLDDFDYELANRHSEKKYDEYKDLTSFNDVLNMFGKTRNDI